MRANPKTFCTKWLEQSNAMTDEEHAEMDAKSRDAKQLAWLSNNDPEFAKRQAKIRDQAPLARAWNDTAVFSIFKS
jgi:hypothetical protein